MVPQVREEFESRYLQLHKRLTSLRAESEEVWKTLETAESSLMEMISAKDYDVTPYFAAAATIDDDKFPPSTAPFKQPEAALLKLRADRQETEDFYLNVFIIFNDTLKDNLILIACLLFFYSPLEISRVHFEIQPDASAAGQVRIDSQNIGPGRISVADVAEIGFSVDRRHDSQSARRKAATSKDRSNPIDWPA